MVNIAKVESNGKNKFIYFFIAEAYPILWVSPKTQLYSFLGTNMTNMVYFAVFYHSR